MLTCLFTLDLIYPGCQVCVRGAAVRAAVAASTSPNLVYSISQASGLTILKASNNYRRTEYTHFPKQQVKYKPHYAITS